MKEGKKRDAARKKIPSAATRMGNVMSWRVADDETFVSDSRTPFLNKENAKRKGNKIMKRGGRG